MTQNKYNMVNSFVNIILQLYLTTDDLKLHNVFVGPNRYSFLYVYDSTLFIIHNTVTLQQKMRLKTEQYHTNT